MIYNEIAQAISKLNLPGLSKVILFGSAARGSNTALSDIDIAIITSELIKRAERRMIVQAVSKFETPESMLEINCLYATEEDLSGANRWSDPCTDIREDGIVLWQKEVPAGHI